MLNADAAARASSRSVLGPIDDLPRFVRLIKGLNRCGPLIRSFRPNGQFTNLSRTRANPIHNTRDDFDFVRFGFGGRLTTGEWVAWTLSRES